MDESTMTTEAEGHRKLPCHECNELKQGRKELKRLKQELRAARQLYYAEQQRARRLQDQLEQTAQDMHDFKEKILYIGTSVSRAGWFDVCADFNRRTRRRPNNSRGISWHRRYLVTRNGRLYICKSTSTDNGGILSDEEINNNAVLTIDLDDNLTVSSPAQDDPEVFLLNRDHERVIKLSYHRTSTCESSSSASDSSDSTFTDEAPSRVLMLEAPTSEQRQYWLGLLQEQLALTRIRCQENKEGVGEPCDLSGDDENSHINQSDILLTDPTFLPDSSKRRASHSSTTSSVSSALSQLNDQLSSDEENTAPEESPKLPTSNGVTPTHEPFCKSQSSEQQVPGGRLEEMPTTDDKTTVGEIQNALLSENYKVTLTPELKQLIMLLALGIAVTSLLLSSQMSSV